MDYFKILFYFSISYMFELVNAVHLVISEGRVSLNPAPRASLDLRTASLITTDGPRRWSNIWSRRSRYGRTALPFKLHYLPASYVRGKRPKFRRQKLRLLKSRLLRQAILRKLSKNLLGVSPSQRDAVTLATDLTTTGFRHSRLTPSESGDVADKSLIETPVNEDTLNNNALMVLLNSRRSSNRSAEDEKIIGRHLVALGSIRSNSNTAASTAIQRQLRYIEYIPEPAIRRETLKLYVKDMVDKSGFLSETTDHEVIDISDLMTLVDRLGEITERFNHGPVDTGISVTGRNSVNKVKISTSMDTNAKTSETGRRNISRSRISNALSSYNQNPKRIEIPSGTHHHSELSSFKSRWNSANSRSHSGSVANKPPGVVERDRIRMMVVGKTIYGDTPQLLVRLSTSTTTTPETVTTARVRKSEPLGGTGTYWTHLRSGLVDLLCKLCQERAVESCIIRYCNNDSSLP